jgi:integrase
MATIVPVTIKSGATHWRVLIRLRGWPYKSATFERKTDAKRWAAKIETDLRERRHFGSWEAKRHTFADLIDRYVREGFQHKPRSFQKQKSQLDWWKAELGVYRLSDLTPALISEKKSKLLAEEIDKRGNPKKRAPSTVNRYLAAPSHACTIAVKEWHWMTENPFLQVKKLAEPKGRTRFLFDAEREALIKACRESQPPELLLVVLVALTTGARWGEILNLRWGDLDFERSLLILRDTKNKDTRSVPVAGEVLELLLQRSKVRRIDSDLVFPSARGNTPITLHKPFDKALQRAGIENFRFHDLRHTAASYLAMSGATLSEIAAVLGHRTLQMVKRYSHLTDQHTAGIVGKMHRKFFSG